MDLSALISSQSDKQVRALAKMEKRLDARSVALQKELYAMIRDRFLDSLSRDENGRLIYNSSNIARVNDMVNTWEYFRESKMRPEMLQFGKDLISIVDVEAGYFMAIGKEFDIPMEFETVRQLIAKQVGITLDASPTIIKGSYLDRLIQAAPIQDKVTNIVLENVSAKASFTALKRDLSEVIMGNEEVNGAMTKYLRTYAYDTFSVVQRTVDLNMADTYGFNCFVYEGNLIKDSREFCQQHLGEIICRDQFPQFEAQDWAGKNPDLPFEVALGGYNCRHNPMWIPDEAKPYLEEGGNVSIEEGVVVEAFTKGYKNGGEVFEANLGDDYKFNPIIGANWKSEFESRLIRIGSKFEGGVPPRMTIDDANFILEGIERGAAKYGTEVKNIRFKKSYNTAGQYNPITKDIYLNYNKLGNTDEFKYLGGKETLASDAFTIGNAIPKSHQLISTTIHESYHATYFQKNLHKVWVDALERNFGAEIPQKPGTTWTWDRIKNKYIQSKAAFKQHEYAYRPYANLMRRSMREQGYNVSDYWMSSAWESFAETGAQIELGYAVDPRLYKAFKETLSAIKY